MYIAPRIVIDSRQNDYQKNADLLGVLIERLTGSVIFSSPSPDIATLTAAKDLLVAAIATHGPKGNRGGKPALLDLRKQSAIAHRLIKSEVQYITNVAMQLAESDAALMASIMSTCGLKVRNERHPQGAVGQVQDIHQVNEPGLRRNQVSWLWKRHLAVTNPKNIRFYKVFRSTLNDFSTARVIATPTKARIIDSNNTGETITYFYWFCAVTADGDGSLSNSISVMLLPA